MTSSSFFVSARYMLCSRTRRVTSERRRSLPTIRVTRIITPSTIGRSINNSSSCNKGRRHRPRRRRGPPLQPRSRGLRPLLRRCRAHLRRHRHRCRWLRRRRCLGSSGRRCLGLHRLRYRYDYFVVCHVFPLYFARKCRITGCDYFVAWCVIILLCMSFASFEFLLVFGSDLGIKTTALLLLNWWLQITRRRWPQRLRSQLPPHRRRGLHLQTVSPMIPVRMFWYATFSRVQQ